MTKFVGWNRDECDVVIDLVVAAIKASPGHVFVEPDGLKAYVLSSRSTDVYVRVDALDDANFNDMNIEEIREHIRRRLDNAGMEDIEF